MSARETCHGCEGKGWVLIISRERTNPFFQDGRRVAGEVSISREYQPVTCPVCHGNGLVKRVGDIVLAEAAGS